MDFKISNALESEESEEEEEENEDENELLLLTEGVVSDDAESAESDAEYEPENILVARTYRGKVQYLVKWKGHTLQLVDLTWESHSNLAKHGQLGRSLMQDYKSNASCWPPASGVNAKDFAETQ